MKKVVLSLSFLLMFMPVLFSQNYFINEDFNSGIPSTWTNTAVSGSFPWMNGKMDDVSNMLSGVSLDGTPMVYFNDDSLGGAHLNNTVELLSPIVTTVPGIDLTLEFDYNFRSYLNATDYFMVEVHDGTKWDTLLYVNSDDCGRWQTSVCPVKPHPVFDLSAYAGLTLQLRFTYHDGDEYSYWAALDNVQLWSSFNYDIKAISINTPVSNCGLTSQEAVNVTVQNVGVTPVSNFLVSYSVNGGSLVTETVAATVNPNDFYSYTFNQRGNFAGVGTYEVVMYTSDTNDLNHLNDTVSRVIESYTPDTPDYYQDFESGATDWALYGTNSSLNVGTPAGAYISSAYSGTGAAVSNLSGNYNNNETSYLEVPCMNFSFLPGVPIMEFALTYNLAAGDQLWMEESFDGGVNWSKVDQALNSNNWYNNTQDQVWDGQSGGWIWVENVLEDAYRSSNKSQIKFRFVLKTNGSGVAEGFAIDDFSIHAPAQTDVKLKRIISPDNSSTCGFRNEQDIIVELFNQGYNTVTSLILNYQVKSGPNGPSPVVSDTATVVIPQNSPYLLVHSIPADLGEIGSYEMDFWIEVPNDGNLENDSILDYTFDHIAVNSLSVDFTTFPLGAEANGLGWTTKGSNGYTWKIEDREISPSPSGPAMDHTTVLGDGKYAYTDVPDLTGIGENATFTSPCVNLGLMQGAIITFWYHKYGGAMGDLFVEVLDPLTKNWIAVNSIYGSTHFSKTEDWKLGSARITTPYSSRVRFRGYSRGYTTGNMAIDDIEIFPPEEMDGMIRNIIEPVTDCNLKNDEKFTVEIGNFGQYEIDTVPIAYTIDTNGVLFTDTVNGVVNTVFTDTAFAVGLLPGAILTYTFNNLLDLSKYDQTYTITLWVDIPNDGRRSNDTIVHIVNNETQHFPYLETFSLDADTVNGVPQLIDQGYFNSFYTASPIDATLYSWQLESGAPPAGNGQTKDHTTDSIGLVVPPLFPNPIPFPSIYMVVNSANANAMSQQTANLISPCIDLNNVPAANLEFWYHMYVSNPNDKHSLHIDVHNGSFWEEDVYVMDQTFDMPVQNAPWRKRVVTLSKYTGNFVQVRFRGVSPQGSIGPSFSIDDVGLVLPPAQQVALDTIVTPDAGRCNYWPNEVIRARVRNVGLDNIDSLIMGYEINHPIYGWMPEVIDTVVFADLGKLPIAPGDTRTVAFPTVADLSDYGPYDVKVTLRLPGDINPLDDDFDISFVHPVPVNLPYIVDFSDNPANVPDGTILDFSTIGWYATHVNGFEWEADNVDIEPGTGPSVDHTYKKNVPKSRFLVTKPQPSPPFAPSGNGEYAVVVTPCMSLPDVDHAFMEFYYHRFGPNLALGDMRVDVYDDRKWVEISRINGMTHLSKSDDWTREKIDLQLFDHQNARFRFRSSHHGVNSHSAIDDLYVGALPEYDLAIDSIVSPSGKAKECYSEFSSVDVRVRNNGVYDLDFTIDTLLLVAEVYVNGMLKDKDSTLVNSNVLNPSQMPLVTDSLIVIRVDSLDLSEYNKEHIIKVYSHIFRDSINLFNDTLISNITPTIHKGVISVNQSTICGGATTILSVEDFQGSLEWQYRRELPTGVIWSPVFPLNGTKELLVKPSDTTWYRLKYCNANNSDSILIPDDSIRVNVINTPAPTYVVDTVCQEGQIVLTPGVTSLVDTVNWYHLSWEEESFLTSMTYSEWHEDVSDTFYVEAVINGCLSPRTEVHAIVAPFPEVDLGPDTIVCPDSLYYFNAGGGKDYKYEWKRTGDPRPYDSLDNSVQVISINPYEIMKLDPNATTTKIDLSVIVTSPYKCVSYDTVSITVLHSSDTSLCITGLNETALNNSIQLHPNPTSGNVQVSVNLHDAKDAAFEIYSIDGKAVFERKTIPTKNYVKNVDLSNLPNGIYFVKLITSKGTVVKKLVLTN